MCSIDIHIVFIFKAATNLPSHQSREQLFFINRLAHALRLNTYIKTLPKWKLFDAGDTKAQIWPKANSKNGAYKSYEITIVYMKVGKLGCSLLRPW